MMQHGAVMESMVGVMHRVSYEIVAANVVRCTMLVVTKCGNGIEENR